MKTLAENPYIALVARVTLGVVFVFAGVEKIVAAEQFAKSIANYQILPLFAVNVSALILPWVEVLCGVFLLFGVRQRANSALTGILLAVFIVAILSAMSRDLNINCGCFAQGGEGTKVGWKKIFEDLALLALAAYIFFFPNQRFSFHNADA